MGFPLAGVWPAELQKLPSPSCPVCRPQWDSSQGNLSISKRTDISGPLGNWRMLKNFQIPQDEAPTWHAIPFLRCLDHTLVHYLSALLCTKLCTLSPIWSRVPPGKRTEKGGGHWNHHTLEGWAMASHSGFCSLCKAPHSFNWSLCKILSNHWLSWLLYSVLFPFASIAVSVHCPEIAIIPLQSGAN